MKKKYSTLTNVQKRDGSIVPFDEKHIFRAITRAMDAVGDLPAQAGGGEKDAEKILYKVLDELLNIKKTQKEKHFIPSVEKIQDLIENELIAANFVQTAKAFILYRKERANVREKVGFVPERVKELVEESKKYFKNPLAEFVYYRTYAKWIDIEGRRETWIETVDRYISFMKENLNGKLTKEEYSEIREAILNQEAMPSMRLLQFSGAAARKTNICAYNCSFIAPRTFTDFAEIMYVSMCGTGVGWSVESENIQALPQIQKQTRKILKTYIIPDSKEGWADAFSLGLKTWFSGQDIMFDYSLIRPAGSRLKTMGGKSSGPEPLRSLLEFSKERILRKQGRHLTNLDAHDIICKIGECVVAGGVRRSAMISLSDLDDEAIRDSKKGQFYLNEGQRMLANNSAVYLTKPTTPEFLDEWTALVKSGSGERGIFNRGGLAKTLPARRLKQWENGFFPSWGTNPCGEIILQSKQFCNLSEVVARSNDTEESLMKKIRVATIIGTYQSSLTYFPYLSKEWKKNCEKERLLGVSITGQWDCEIVRNGEILEKLRKYSVEINKKYAKKFEINPSTCITCVKPSGKKHYTEHNPSVTISVGENEWIAVANWVYENWDLVGGLSFLPRSNHVYQLAPYETITKEKYEEMIKKVSDLDFSKIVTYEVDDETEVKKELACVSGVCEV
ncbi:MAG: ATP cone domain-containing protein [Candidatus Nomurabacteria bacterium]|nr:ATP cone domain-containing protein [Candidatus Nomurabacteria bacterium]